MASSSRNGREQRGEQQHALVLGAGTAEDLPGEVGEDRFLALGQEDLGRAAMRVREVLPHQHDAGGPSVIGTMDGRRQRGVELHRCGDGPRLLFGETQFLPFDPGNALLRDQPRHLGRRRFAGDEGEVQAVGDFAQSLGKGMSPARFAARLVEIVDDQQRSCGEEGEELAQEPARERRQVLRVLGREQRQRGGASGAFSAQTCRCHAQVVEKGRRIRVPGVGLEPDSRQPARLDVAGDEGGLARPGGAGDPDDRMPVARIEQREQAFAAVHVVQARRTELGERRRGRAAPRMRRPARRRSARIGGVSRGARISRRHLRFRLGTRLDVARRARRVRSGGLRRRRFWTRDRGRRRQDGAGHRCAPAAPLRRAHS